MIELHHILPELRAKESEMDSQLPRLSSKISNQATGEHLNGPGEEHDEERCQSDLGLVQKEGSNDMLRCSDFKQKH